HARDATSMAPIDTTTITATTRCEYSMTPCRLAGAVQPPAQRGHESRHPSPDPVARTSAPIDASTSVATADVSARRRKAWILMSVADATLPWRVTLGARGEPRLDRCAVRPSRRR